MTRKRYKDQIVSQILVACQGDGISKTKIVYASNLNFRTIKPYIDLLLRNNLLEIMDGHIALYKTTERGLKALEHFEAIEELIHDFRRAS